MGRSQKELFVIGGARVAVVHPEGSVNFDQNLS
jgi:hypothetical protein